MDHVFISYAREDENFKQELAVQLTASGIGVWDDSGIRSGTEWRVEIDKAIQAAAAVIVVMSPLAQGSEYVTYEWAFALGAGKPVLPVLIDQTTLHPRLAAIQYADFTDDQRPWGRFVEQVRNPPSPVVDLTLRKAADQILHYLRDKRWRKISFRRIRKNVNSTYGDDLLNRLIDEMPTVFRRSNIRGRGPGLALIRGE